MMEVIDGKNINYASVTKGFLNVCLCDKTCASHVDLKNLLNTGQSVLIYVQNESGEIVPLTIEDTK